MSVAMVVGTTQFEVGTADFLRAFFSTVAVRCEDGVWGSRYPAIMLDLYAGRLPAAKLSSASKELVLIRDALARWPPESVVWDVEDLAKQPPWGRSIAASITSLADYWYTADGEDLFVVLTKAIGLAATRAVDLTIS